MTPELVLYFLMGGLALAALACVLWLAVQLVGVMCPGNEAGEADRENRS